MKNKLFNVNLNMRGVLKTKNLFIMYIAIHKILCHEVSAAQS